MFEETPAYETHTQDFLDFAAGKTMLTAKEQCVFAVDNDGVRPDGKPWMGCHTYRLKNSIGMFDNEVKFNDTEIELNFMLKKNDGTDIPGIMNEQLYIVLIDRLTKLNEAFPSEQTQMQITLLYQCLLLQEMRVKDRLKRGVMGQHKI